MPTSEIAPYAPVVIKLLQGVLCYDEPAHWDLLLSHTGAVADYFARIGLELYVNEADGFAFVRQPEREDGDGQRVPLPRLTRRDRLSYHVTLLCVLLRERLDQFDAGNPDSDRLILGQDELRDLLRPYYPERGDERALLRRVDAVVERVVDLGFLRHLSAYYPQGPRGGEERYEVRRVLKARLDSEKLADIRRRLEVHHAPDAPDAPDEA